MNNLVPYRAPARYAPTRPPDRYPPGMAPTRLTVNMPRAPRSGTNGSVAPVCPTSKSETIPGQPITILPSIPHAVDLPSVINVVNQMAQVINYMTNPQPLTIINNTLLSLKPEIPTFVETGRVTKTVRIYNPNDSQQWVDVLRTNQLTLRDLKTGGLWQYNRVNLGSGQ